MCRNCKCIKYFRRKIEELFQSTTCTLGLEDAYNLDHTRFDNYSIDRQKENNKILVDNEVINVYSIDEEIELLKHLPQIVGDMVSFAFLSGLRKLNIRLLKFSDVNFNFKFITIPPSKFKGGKTHIIPLTDKLEEIIKRNKNNTDYVFINPKTSEPYSDDVLSNIFKSACKTVGITGKRFHDIRHTTATRLIEKGVDIITVKELLGHSSVSITQKYTHTSLNKKMEALKLLNSYK